MRLQQGSSRRTNVEARTRLSIILAEGAVMRKARVRATVAA
jgi:hypothetical protein